MAKIKKTATELKQDALFRAYKKKLATQQAKSKNRKKKKAPLYESIKVLRSLSYSGFLKSKYWQLVRQKVLKRDNHQCVICKNTKFLQIHHDTYKNHFKELHNLQDLLTLCSKCHKEHHYAQP